MTAKSWEPVADAPCPVCWRPVWVSARGRVEHHTDKASRPCPMGGGYLHANNETAEDVPR
ncbi:hypothetical protein I1A62_29955 [Rhodococcus sp. USK10]|uniref:DUF7368 family protein n=1 Tax=Rhodococcus sp. USK10 TaxID=2789739 RepID=UPI001C5FF80C|nr:hypothetical protein [Rhodococcus sp. USK10]QYB01459.1 hypothetical protein I1A62_29955 [Rhodococcus sp. USK10]